MADAEVVADEALLRLARRWRLAYGRPVGAWCDGVSGQEARAAVVDTARKCAEELESELKRLEERR